MKIFKIWKTSSVGSSLLSAATHQSNADRSRPCCGAASIPSPFTPSESWRPHAGFFAAVARSGLGTPASITHVALGVRAACPFCRELDRCQPPGESPGPPRPPRRVRQVESEVLGGDAPFPRAKPEPAMITVRAKPKSKLATNRYKSSPADAGNGGRSLSGLERRIPRRGPGPLRPRLRGVFVARNGPLTFSGVFAQS